MSETVIAQKEPYEVELEPGTYWWCACGRSKDQPFCDGSHQGTDFEPVELKVEKKQTYWLCGCKATSDQPHCDGSHNKL
jgi:CDGSH iron-sulfur domain-containing protein 3